MIHCCQMQMLTRILSWNPRKHLLEGLPGSSPLLCLVYTMFLAVKLTTFQAIMDKTGWTGYNDIHCGRARLTNMIGCRCGFRFSKFSIIAMVVTVEMRNLVDCSQTRWTQQNVTVHNRPQNLEVVHSVMGNIYNASHGLYKFCYILLRIMRVLSSFVNCFVTIPVTSYGVGYLFHCVYCRPVPTCDGASRCTMSCPSVRDLGER